MTVSSLRLRIVYTAVVTILLARKIANGYVVSPATTLLHRNGRAHADSSRYWNLYPAEDLASSWRASTSVSNASGGHQHDLSRGGRWQDGSQNSSTTTRQSCIVEYRTIGSIPKPTYL